MTALAATDSPVAPVVAERPLRRDAERNRQRLLAAAMEVFADEGLGAPVESVARRAGVGVGTLYRRFPSKDALVTAVAEALGAHLADRAERAAAGPEGLESFLAEVGALQSRYGAALSRVWLGVPEPTRTSLSPRLHRLLRDAQAAGRVRADLAYEDIGLLMWSMAAVAERTREVAPQVWRRHLALLLDGLRPSGRRLSPRPLSRAQLDRLQGQASPS